jgi:hypothetical protein
MTAEQFKNIKDWFESYVDDITPDDETLSALIDLKRVHSAEVAVNCKEIAEDANFSGPDIRTAEALGVLHDAGRFSQIVKFRTFSDSESFNHGEHGYDILVKSDVLSPLSDLDRDRILCGIRYHNSRFVPDDLDPGVLPFVGLIRDADKLDIYRVISETLRNGDYDRYPEITLHIDFDGPVNPAVLDQIRDQKTVSYDNVKSLHDFRIAQFSWLYDLNYEYTYRQMVERGFLAEITESLPDDKDVTDVVRAAQDYIESGGAS